MSKTLALVAKCNKCNHPIHKTFSRLAYERGLVLVQCDGCKVRHLVADHLGWFSDVKGNNLEDFYPGQVKYGTLHASGIGAQGEIEVNVDNIDESLLDGISKQELQQLLVKATNKKD